jgi:hypothetical protein
MHHKSQVHVGTLLLELVGNDISSSGICASSQRPSEFYIGADKSLARPGRKQATAKEDIEFHISYL